jgi:hypothetical protein
MFESGDAVDSFDKLTPTIALGCEYLLPFGSQTVITTPALACLLDPTPLNPTASFESIEQWVEGSDVKMEHPARALFDEIADVIPMSRLILNE